MLGREELDNGSTRTTQGFIEKEEGVSSVGVHFSGLLYLVQYRTHVYQVYQRTGGCVHIPRLPLSIVHHCVCALGFSVYRRGGPV